MTESDWLHAADADKMLKQLPKLKHKLSPRKLRLFCVGCCRQIFDVMEENCRQAVDMAERHADGAATLEEMTTAREPAARRNRRRFDIFGLIRAQKSPEKMREHGTARWCWEATEGATRPGKPVPGKVIQGVAILSMQLGRERLPLAPEALSIRGIIQGLTEAPLLAGILRDVAGNPFRPATINPIWQTGNATALAQSIYEDRAFDRLPILADALEDAGCTNADVLNHCRGGGEHVRGCWVVDLVLGKK